MDEVQDAVQDEVQLWRGFGRFIEELRVDRGLNRQQLVDKTAPPGGKPAVSYHALMFLEQGGHTVRGEWVTPNPRDPQLVALARALGMPVERFYARVGRYADRPRTKASRTGVGLRAARDEADLREELREMEDRVDRVEELLRRHGIDVDDEEPPRRRRGRAG